MEDATFEVRFAEHMQERVVWRGEIMTREQVHAHAVALIKARMAELYAEHGPTVWDLLKPYIDELHDETAALKAEGQ